MSNLPQLPACILNKKNNNDKHWTTTYTFTKLGDNLTNNDGDIRIANSNST